MASDIEDWINNLTLLNQNVETDAFSKELKVSMLSNDGEAYLTDDRKVERQLANISHIANNRELISI